MSQYQIRFQPFYGKKLGDLGTQNINIKFTNENLAGFLLMSNRILSANQIEIKGIPIPIDSHLGQGKLKYNALFKDLPVQFETIDGFQGAIVLCNLLGKPWTQLIKNLNVEIISGTYFGKISLTQSGEMIDIRMLPQFGVNLMTTNTIIRDQLDCFKNYPGFFLPSDIHLSSLDSSHHDVVAVAAVTSNKYLGAFYIYNACTYSPYQRKGLMKSILIGLINEILQSHPGWPIYLEVEPQIPAYQLYSGLGFQKVGELWDMGKYYYLMKFA